MTKKIKNSSLLRYLPEILIFAVIITIAILAINSVGKSTEQESLTIAENSIRRAIITCYSQEGRYPASIEYLEENYGLHISDDYEVFYDIFAENIMPEVTVIRKQVKG